MRRIRAAVAGDLERRARRRLNAWSDLYEETRGDDLTHEETLRILNPGWDLAIAFANLQYSIADVVRGNA